MNDPGADKAISEAAREKNLHIQPHQTDHDQDRIRREKQQSAYNDPSLWWVASTGCPLVAGTFGPLANAFSVCALVRGWRVFIPDGQTELTGDRIVDPAWTLAVNALSLVCAVVANAALLLNMSRRLSFKIAQPISVIGFLVAGILLVVDLSIFVSSPTYHIPVDDPAAPSERHALTSAFYYAVQAATIYLIIAGLMSLTAWGAWKGHFEGGFRLTLAQRTLMLQTMSFVIYLLLGALVYSHVEGWDYLDAVYWADLTLLTIGLGSDFAPRTRPGRILFFFFVIGGIIMIGLVIGSIRTLVLDRGKRKLSARIMEKKRLRAINSIDPVKRQISVSRFATMRFDNDQLDVAMRRRLEFTVMRKVQEHAERDRKWVALFVSTTAAFSLWLLGAAVFQRSERPQGWSYFDSMYFSYACLITVGYGDLYPQSNAGRAFFVFWTLLAVPTLTILISDMSDTVIAAFSDLTVWLGSLTVLPDDEPHAAAPLRSLLRRLRAGDLDLTDLFSREDAAMMAVGDDDDDGVPSDMRPADAESNPRPVELAQGISARLASHLDEAEWEDASSSSSTDNSPEALLARDPHFYHLVLAREIRRLMRDLRASGGGGGDGGAQSVRRYSWHEWEYFLRLMDNVMGPDVGHVAAAPGMKHINRINDNDDGNGEDDSNGNNNSGNGNGNGDDNGNGNGNGNGNKNKNHGREEEEEDDIGRLVPHTLRQTSTIAAFRRNKADRRYTWLGRESPLLSWKGETEWILERLGVALERDLVSSRRRGQQG